MKARFAALLLTILVLASCSDPEEEEAARDGATATVSVATSEVPAPSDSDQPTATATSAVSGIAPHGTPVPAPEGWESVRWANLTINRQKLEDPDGVLVFLDLARPTTKPVIFVAPQASSGGSYITVDATSGEVLEDRLRAADRSLVTSALAALRFSPLEVSELPWPYTGEPPADRARGVNVRFFEPDPMSGTRVVGVVGDPGPGAPSSCGGAISLENWRSQVAVDTCEGRLYEETAILHPDDEAAFLRWAESVQPVTTP
jgi:hypothetical protein